MEKPSLVGSVTHGGNSTHVFMGRFYSCTRERSSSWHDNVSFNIANIIDLGIYKRKLDNLHIILGKTDYTTKIQVLTNYWTPSGKSTREGPTDSNI